MSKTYHDGHQSRFLVNSNKLQIFAGEPPSLSRRSTFDNDKTPRSGCFPASGARASLAAVVGASLAVDKAAFVGTGEKLVDATAAVAVGQAAGVVGSAVGKVGLVAGFGESLVGTTAAADSGKAVARAVVAGGSHSEKAAALAVGKVGSLAGLGETLVGRPAAVVVGKDVAAADTAAVAGKVGSLAGEKLDATAAVAVGQAAGVAGSAVGKVGLAAGFGESLVGTTAAADNGKAVARAVVAGGSHSGMAAALAVGKVGSLAGFAETLVGRPAAVAVGKDVAAADTAAVAGKVGSLAGEKLVDATAAVAVGQAAGVAGSGDNHFEMVAAGETVAVAGSAQSRSAVAGSAAVVVAVGKAAKVAGKNVPHRSLELMLSLLILLNALPEILLLSLPSMGTLSSSHLLDQRRSVGRCAARKSAEVQRLVPLLVESLVAESGSISMGPELAQIPGLRGNPNDSLGLHPDSIRGGGNVAKIVESQVPSGKTLCELENSTLCVNQL